MQTLFRNAMIVDATMPEPRHGDVLVEDGVDEIRRAARQEFWQGARFLKIMANGGVGSPTDPSPGSATRPRR